jgi:hypothetical protein
MYNIEPLWVRHYWISWFRQACFGWWLVAILKPLFCVGSSCVFTVYSTLQQLNFNLLLGST